MRSYANDSMTDRKRTHNGENSAPVSTQPSGCAPYVTSESLQHSSTTCASPACPPSSTNHAVSPLHPSQLSDLYSSSASSSPFSSAKSSRISTPGRSTPLVKLAGAAEQPCRGVPQQTRKRGVFQKKQLGHREGEGHESVCCAAAVSRRREGEEADLAKLEADCRRLEVGKKGVDAFASISTRTSPFSLPSGTTEASRSGSNSLLDDTDQSIGGGSFSVDGSREAKQNDHGGPSSHALSGTAPRVVVPKLVGLAAALAASTQADLDASKISLKEEASPRKSDNPSGSSGSFGVASAAGGDQRRSTLPAEPAFPPFTASARPRSSSLSFASKAYSLKARDCLTTGPSFLSTSSDLSTSLQHNKSYRHDLCSASSLFYGCFRNFSLPSADFSSANSSPSSSHARPLQRRSQAGRVDGEEAIRSVGDEAEELIVGNPFVPTPAAVEGATKKLIALGDEGDEKKGERSCS